MAIVNLTSENFDKEVINSNKKVLVDFWASWCGHCKSAEPVVEEVAKELEGDITVGKVNIDEQPDLATEYDVISIPTFIVFENGEPKRTQVGSLPKEELINLIEKNK